MPSGHASLYSGCDKSSSGGGKLLRFIWGIFDSSVQQSEWQLLERLRDAQGNVRGAQRPQHEIILFISVRSTWKLEWQNGQQGE